MALSKIRTTQSVSTLAQQTLDEEERKKKSKRAQAEKQKQDTSSKGKGGSIAEGAAAGAVAGSVVPGIGTLIGAGIGAAGAAVSANKAEKDAASSDPNRPERRRLQKGIDIKNERKRSKERALATLSQAVFDWAASIR